MTPRKRFYIQLNLPNREKAVWPLLFRSSDEATRYGMENRVFRREGISGPYLIADGRQVLSWSVEASR